MLAYLQIYFDMSLKDIALFVGGFLVIIAVLILGWYGGRPVRDWAGNFGWFVLLLAAACIAWGMYSRGPAY